VAVRWPPETFLCWKLEGMAAAGMRVTVAARPTLDPDAKLQGVKVVELPYGDDVPGSRAVTLKLLGSLVAAPLQTLRLLYEIHRAPSHWRRWRGGWTWLLRDFLPLVRLRPDVVHFEWQSAAVNYLPLYKAWRAPVVASSHGSDGTLYPHVPGYDWTRRLPAMFEAVTAVHCVSDSLRHATVGLGLEKTKARVIRQGVDPQLFRPNGGPPEDQHTFRLISIAWLRWVKGFEWGVEAVRRLVEAGVPVEFTILGDDPKDDAGEPRERARILHTVADAGLERHVRLVERASSAEVARKLQASHACLLPSLDEGLPTVALEAMASGVPVVATNCGGICEAITDGVEGFVVPPRDTEAIAAALMRLWREPELRERMGAAGRRTATSRFTLDRHLEEFHALYREVAGA
jgi:colanic acid/amylovoran biosynthesis glycosyltransferase